MKCWKNAQNFRSRTFINLLNWKYSKVKFVAT